MAFHSYPQLIRKLLKVYRFGPSLDFTRASTWPWVDHLRFGSIADDCRPIQTRFRCAFAPEALKLAADNNSRAHYAKGTPSPRGASTACRQPVSGTLNSPHRGAFHHSLTVLCAIGRQGIFSLTPWSAQIHTGFHVSRATQVSLGSASIVLREYHPLSLAFPGHSHSIHFAISRSYNPAWINPVGLGCSAFVRHY